MAVAVSTMISSQCSLKCMSYEIVSLHGSELSPKSWDQGGRGREE